MTPARAHQAERGSLVSLTTDDTCPVTTASYDVPKDQLGISAGSPYHQDEASGVIDDSVRPACNLERGQNEDRLLDGVAGVCRSPTCGSKP